MWKTTQRIAGTWRMHPNASVLSIGHVQRTVLFGWSHAGTASGGATRNRARYLGLALAIGTLTTAGCGSSSKHAPTRSVRSATTTTTSTVSTATSSARSAEVTASAGSSLEVSASVAGVTATMHGSTHEPKVAERWFLHLTVIHGGRPAKAGVTYEFVFGGQVVARREHYAFDGHFTDNIEWPSTAVGYPLEFRAAIVSDGATINLDYPVRVRT